MARRAAQGSARFEDIGRAFAYPLQPAALTSILAYALALMTGSLPVLGFALALVVWAAAYRYAIAVLERSAAGVAAAPDYVLDAQPRSGAVMLVLQLAFIALNLVVSLWVDDNGQRYAWWALLALLQPAITINLVLTGDIGSALNPVGWFQLITRIGLGYLLLVVVGALCLSVQGHANALLHQWLPGLFATVIAGFVAFYLLVFNFHLMGRIVYGRRLEIGFEPEPVDDVLDPTTRHQGFMRETERMIADGKLKEAAAALKLHLDSEPHTTEAMHRRYRRLLEQTGDIVALGAHTQTHVSRLLGERRERDAMLLVQEVNVRDPDFRLRDADQRAQIVRTALRSGMPEVALVQAADFHITWPKHEAVPELALLAARLLVDRRSDTAGARAVLAFAAERFPDDPLQQEILLKIEQIQALEARLDP